MIQMNEYDLAKAFHRIEDELIASMVRNMARHRVEEIGEGYAWNMWQAEMLKSLEKYKRINQKKYGKQFKDINSQIEALILIAGDQGGLQQEIAILHGIQRGWKYPHIPERTQEMLEAIEGANHGQLDALLDMMLAEEKTGSFTGKFFKVNDRKLDALVRATVQDMEKAETAILRKANDDYRKIIFDAQVYANTGAGTYEKAVDMATKDMLSRGLNCVEYANGARHTLADYADMAIRTACKRAYLQGEGKVRKEWGISTVIMNKRGNPCPKCLPWVGKVLIDDVWSGGSRKDRDYPLMRYAISKGLYHPRCRDSHTTYFPGISTADDTWTEDELEAIGQSSMQEAKQQYTERQEKKYGRLAKYSLDPENQVRYQKKEEEWEEQRKGILYRVKKYIEEQSVKRNIHEFEGKLKQIANPDVRTLLEQSRSRIIFGLSRKNVSYFSKKRNIIYLVPNASSSSIAHELFHEIDQIYGISESGILTKPVKSDFKRLKSISESYGMNVEDMLYSKYPEIFTVDDIGDRIFLEKYRGISDILHGMSQGRIVLGYGHFKKGYWEQSLKIEKETWAQYGRMLYEEDGEVLSVLEDIFPETTQTINHILKGMTK